MAGLLGIVRGHKGAVFVDGEQGRGTTVRVLFPVCAGLTTTEAESADATPPVQEDAVAPGTILVADDEATVRAVAKDMLESLGFAALVAADGEEAVAIFREHADEVDCVIFDLTMPRKGGVAAFRELRRIRPNVRCIASSGHDEADAMQQFEGEGPAAFLQKPYTIEALRATMANVLNGS